MIKLAVNSKFGIGLMVIAVIVSILGSIGFTTEDSVDSIPTPNVPNSVFFADEPMQSNPLALLINANVQIFNTIFCLWWKKLKRKHFFAIRHGVVDFVNNFHGCGGDTGDFYLSILTG